MRIDKVAMDVVRPDAAQELRRDSDAPKPEIAQAGQEVARVDRVEISDAGRALAESASRDSTLGPDAVSEFKQMVVGGKYDRPEVIAEVARRMEASGDLRQDLASE